MQMHPSTPNVLPMPFREEKTRGVQPRAVPPPKQAKEEDFPAQSSFVVTKWRMLALVVVLVAVTLSMVASFVFLFSGIFLPPPLSVFSFSWSFVGWSALGVGGGILLWIMLTSLLKRYARRQPVQKEMTLSTMTLFPSGGRAMLPPEPMDRQTGELFSPAWAREPQRQTETLEVLHLRQRLQTLGWDDSEERPRAADRSQMTTVPTSGTAPRKTDALGEVGTTAAWERR